MSSFPKPSLPSASLYYSARSYLATGVYRRNHVDVYRKPTETTLVSRTFSQPPRTAVNVD
jgi:hypothetical protein